MKNSYNKKKYKMRNRLTERDLSRIVRRVVNEEKEDKKSMNDISDESVMDIEKRRYYVQSYQFTLMGFLIDEDEFEVQPAVTRIFQMYEVDTQIKKKRQKREEPNIPSDYIPTYPSGVTESIQTFEYTVNLTLGETTNVDNFSVYINGDYYGDNIEFIQINTNDVLRITVVKPNVSDDTKIIYNQELL